MPIRRSSTAVHIANHQPQASGTVQSGAASAHPGRRASTLVQGTGLALCTAALICHGAAGCAREPDKANAPIVGDTRIGPGANAVIFETVVRAAATGTEPADPSVYLAMGERDLQGFAKYLREPDRVAIEGSDFASRVIIAVFAGARGASGHAIEVDALDLSGTVLRVRARITVPGSGDPGLAAFFVPYHVIAVPRSSIAASKPATWILVDSAGKKMAGGRF